MSDSPPPSERQIFTIGHSNQTLTAFIDLLKHSDLTAGIHPLTSAGLNANEKILFTISLGEPFEGFCYKLVAAVILIPPLWKN